jgi:5'-nucleotidase
VSSLSRRLTVVATATLFGAPLLAVTPAQAADPVTINLIDINDFHGRIDANTVKFAGTIEKLRAESGEANTLFLSAGDNIGASLFASASQQDKPTLDVLNALDLAVSTVGNHEFDKGAADLFGRVTDSSDFGYLGANVVDKTTGEPLLPAYETFTVSGLDVAVVGAITEETPSLVSPGGIANVAFTDPVDAVNKTVTELEASADAPDVIVAAYHEGAGAGLAENATLEQEVAEGGAFADIVTKTDKDVDAIFTGHTHKQYAWDGPIPGVAGKTRPIVQTGSYGENIGQVKLSVDSVTGDVVSYKAVNVARVTTDDATLVNTYPRVAAVKPIVDAALTQAAAVGNQPIGEQTADITRARQGSNLDDRGSESTLGNLVADALLAKVAEAPSGADLGVVNPGGLRSDLLRAGTGGTNTDGVITYAEANSVLPFVNALNTVSLKGSSLKKVLEQQWQRNADGSVPSRAYLQLGLSKNVKYTFDPARAEGSRITSVTISGEPLDPDKTYKVATFSFLATGGDNFRAFTEGTAVDAGLVDYEAWIEYLGDNSPVSPDFARRSIQVGGVQSAYEPQGAVSVTLPKLDLTSAGSPANTTVSATLTAASSTTPLGDFPVTAGAATVAFSLPAGVAGDATLNLTAAPTGTSVSIPLFVKYASTVEGTLPDRAKTGTSFTVEAAVTSGAEGSPTGTVSVMEGDVVLGSAPLGADGTADVAINASTLTADRHELTLAYSGDDVNAASTTDLGTIDIVKGSSGLTATAAAGTYGESTKVTLKADSAASGVVQVAENGRFLGLGFLIGGAGTITLDGTALAPGAHSLDLFYGGSEKFDPTSTTASVTIAKGSTSIGKISVSPKKIVRNRTKPYVTVLVDGKGFEVDGGKVTLRQSGKSYSGTVKDGKVRIRLGKFTTSGSAKKVTATFSGNGVANGSSKTFTVKVAKK